MTKRKFSTTLESAGEGGSWVIANLPFDSAREFGSKARLPVNVALNGAEFSTSIFPDGKGGHQLLVNKAMQKAACAGPGDKVAIAIGIDRTRLKAAKKPAKG